MPSISATQFLRDQHKILKGLFRQGEVVARRAHDMEEGVMRELFAMIEIHFRMEEELFYPVVIQAASDAGRAIADDCLREHKDVLRLVHALQRRPVHDEFFATGLSNLISTAEEHLYREDNELFLLAETVLGDELYGELTSSLQTMREDLLHSPEYRDALPGLVQNPNGGEQMRKEHRRLGADKPA